MAAAHAVAAAMAATSFTRLAQVEMQLVMQHCDKVTLLRLAQCSRSTLAAASHSFAWRSLSPIPVQCDSPLELSSRVSKSLLRHADLSVRWFMRLASNAANSHGAEGGAGSETQEQWDARAETEAAAVVGLPGLRRLDVRARSNDVTRLCSALLARLDHGGALAGLNLHLYEDALRHADCESLGSLVARSRTLTALRMEGRFGSRALRCLADGVLHGQSLATFSLTRSNLDDEGAAALGVAVAHCRSLTDLQLANCGIRDAVVEALVAALESGGSSSIRSLILTDTIFGPASASALARLLAADRCVLQQLDLSSCGFDGAGAKALAAALQTNHSLTRLQLEYCRIEADGTAALAAAVQSNRHIPLRHLDLSENEVDATGATALAGFLRANTTLEVLDLSACALEDAAMAALAGGLPAAHSLRELRLRRNPFGVKYATTLAAGVRACPTLTLLDVSDNLDLGDSGLAALVPALGHLHAFHAEQCGLTSQSAASLASLLQPGRQLHTLQIDGNAIGAAGVAALAAALHSSPTLHALFLRGCDLDAKAAAALGDALLRGWAVTELQLGHNRLIGDDGARALAAALEQCASRCSLRTLDLTSCRLTLAGALALACAATGVPSLSCLSVYRNPAITEADRPALIAACGPEARFQLQ